MMLFDITQHGFEKFEKRHVAPYFWSSNQAHLHFFVPDGLFSNIFLSQRLHSPFNYFEVICNNILQSVNHILNRAASDFFLYVPKIFLKVHFEEQKLGGLL